MRTPTIRFHLCVCRDCQREWAAPFTSDGYAADGAADVCDCGSTDIDVQDEVDAADYFGPDRSGE